MSLLITVVGSGLQEPSAVAESSSDNTSVVFIAASPQLLPAQIKWSSNALRGANNLLQKQAREIRAKFTLMQHGGASVVKVSKGQSLASKFVNLGLSQKDYFPMGSNLIGVYGDWGTKIKFETTIIDAIAQYPDYLSGLKEGTCRLSLALFNWDTWFAPDCVVVIPRAPEYLRWSLVSFLANTPSLTGGDLLNYKYSQVRYMMDQKLTYTVENGKIVCPGLESLFKVTKIPLRTQASGIIPGYEIVIEPNDIWRAKFILSHINLETLIADAHLEELGSFISFQPRY